MFSIHRNHLPIPEPGLRGQLTAYKNALAAHANTVGVPAPFPTHKELFDRILADPDKDFVVIDDPVVVPPTIPPEEIDRRNRRAAFRQAARNDPVLNQLKDMNPAQFDAWFD